MKYRKDTREVASEPAIETSGPTAIYITLQLSKTHVKFHIRSGVKIDRKNTMMLYELLVSRLGQ